MSDVEVGHVDDDDGQHVVVTTDNVSVSLKLSDDDVVDGQAVQEPFLLNLWPRDARKLGELLIQAANGADDAHRQRQLSQCR